MAFNVNQISLQCGEEFVFMQFIHMNDSVFIWISLDGSFNSLNLAMPSRFVTQLNHGLLIFRITFRLEQL